MKAEYVAPPIVTGIVRLELTLDEAVVLAEILGSDSSVSAITRILGVGNKRGKRAAQILKLEKNLHYNMFDKLDEVLEGASK